MTRLLRISLPILLMGLLLNLAGCSTGLRIAYQQLDRLALWMLGDYVTLDTAQKAEFRREFASLQRWHRSSELPLYSTDLRSLAADFATGPASTETLEQALKQIEAHATRVWEQARPAAAKLLGSLSDEQVATFRSRALDKINDDEAERADETLAERRKRWLRQQREDLERWTGKLNEAQSRLLEAGWDHHAMDLPTPEQRRALRLASVERFVTLLATRKEPGLIERLENNRDERQRLRQEQDNARDRKMLVKLVQACDQRQRTRLRERLLELADDLEALSQTKDSNASIAPPAA